MNMNDNSFFHTTCSRAHSHSQALQQASSSQCKTLHPTQSPEELSTSYESHGKYSHVNVFTRTKGRALLFLSQIWEFCSHSCRTHKVLRIKQLPLQPLSQEHLLSLKSRYTPLSVPHRNTINRDLRMNGPTKKPWKASPASLRDWTTSASPD